MIALTAPVVSSRTSVEPGSPRLSTGFRGTQTSFIVVPRSPESAIRAGMNRAVWFVVGMETRCGAWDVASGDDEPEDVVVVERQENTRAIRTCSSSRVKDGMIRSTSEAERTRSDMRA
jgi:hypothetical protein